MLKQVKTKTKKELQQIKDLSLYDDLCELSDLLNIGYVSSHKREYKDGYIDIYRAYERPSKAKVDSYDELRELYYDSEHIEVIKGLRIIGYNSQKYTTNIVIKYKGHEYLLIDTADYRYLYLY